MNGKAIILLLAIVSVGGMGITSPAFADQEIPYRYLDNIDPNQEAPALTFNIENDTFDHNSIIVITGQVKTVKDMDVSIVVSGPMIDIPSGYVGGDDERSETSHGLNIVEVDQVKISSDGTFSTTINTANPMMKYDGEYQIHATYGSVISHFDYFTLVGHGAVQSSLSLHFFLYKNQIFFAQARCS